MKAKLKDGNFTLWESDRAKLIIQGEETFLSLLSERRDRNVLSPYFLRDDPQPISNHRLIHGIGNADALVAVGPVRVGVAEEEVVPGNDEDFAFLQSFVEFLRGDRQAGKPEPEEQRTLAAVHVPLDVVAECFQCSLAGELAFFLIEWPDDFAAEAENLAGADERQSDLLADVRV